MANEPVIQIKNLKKSFGTREVLKDINFDVHKGEVVCIIGSSGSGKSTLLRCINLLETPTAGSILYHGENILTTGKTHKYCAKVGMVFQQFNLFNNLNVLENCVVGQMKVLKRNRSEAEERAKRYLEQVGMLQYSTPGPVSYRAARNSVWPSPALCPWNRTHCCLTNPPLLWTRKWWAKC